MAVRVATLPNNELSTSTGERRSQHEVLSVGRFRNWKMMAIELAAALLGFGFFSVAIATTVIAGVVCFIAGIGALWLFQCELLGISIDAEMLTMPMRHPWMAALSFQRRTVLLSEVHRLTLSERWLGLEVVRISGNFGSDMLVFATREQRRRFTELIQSICPGVPVYSIRSL